MSFLNTAILAGLGFVSIPIILHFLLRQKPKKLIFPALRLIEKRRKQSVRRLRLRHLWLLLLRILALGLIVLAIARPSLPPANYSLTRTETITVALLSALGVLAYLVLCRRSRRDFSSTFLFEEHKGRLRNWMTLGTLFSLALLVGCPYQQRVAAEITDPKPARELDLPVAGIMVFDTSLSMSYLLEGKTSLQRAQEIARSHLQSLPTGSRMAIAETANDNPVLFQSTLLAARTRLDSFQPQPVSLPVEQRLRDALRLHDDDRRRTVDDQSNLDEAARKDRYIRRVYLFTDLAKSAWRPQAFSLLRNEIDESRGVNLYVIDSGPEQPRNVAVKDVTLSRERIPMGGDLIVSTTIEATGIVNEQATVELLFEHSSGQTSKHGQTAVSLDAGLPVETEFPVVSDLTDRFLHGEVRLATSDPLAFDDVRYFAAEVSPQPKVLVVAPTVNTAFAWMAGLAPNDEFNAAKNSFRPEWLKPGELSNTTLSEYAAVTLINVPRLEDDVWYQLGKYVENGGGLIVVLGSPHDGIADSYNRAQAQAFLPATLYAWVPENDWRFSLDERTHPLFWKFRQLENYGYFARMENDVIVTRFWRADDVAEGANVLATFTDPDRSPAIIERGHGRGRTVLFMTAADLPANSRKRWNNLPSVFLSDLFVIFAQQITEYVSRFTDIEHNYLCGDAPVVSLEQADVPRELLLREPNLKQSRQELPVGETQLVIGGLQDIGHYELAERETLVPVGGFSINAVSQESDLTRLVTEELNERLGEDRYQLARTIDELKDDINASDLGQEIYPMLLMLVIVVFCGEHLVANRFYEMSGGEEWAEPAPSSESL